MINYLRETIKRKDLLSYLVVSGLKSQHRNSFLGHLWWLLDPLLNIGIYYFLVVIILKRGGPNFGGYLVVGMIVWRWIRISLTSSSRSIVRQASIISKVYLPKILFPASTIITQFINFIFGLAVVAIYLLLSRTIPGVEIVWLPFVMIIQFLFLLSLEIVIGYLSVFIRDIENLIGHLTRLWFYTSPVIWEGQRFPEKYNILLRLNPATAFLNSYRNIFLGTGGPEFLKLIVIGVCSLILIGALVFFYSRNEHKILKVL